MLVTAVNNSAAEVRWTDTSSNESGFRIYRRQSTNPFQEVGTVGLNVTVWRNEGLLANSTYEYRVVAFNILGESLSSNAESVTIPVSAFTPIENGESVTRQVVRNGSLFFKIYLPSGVTELEAVLDGSSRVELYVLRDRQPTNSTYNCRAVGTSTTKICRISSPPPSAGDWHILARSTSIINETFSLRVGYVGGEIDDSLGTPTNLQAQVVSGTQIDLSWIDNATGETGYQIQRRTGNGTFQNLVQVAGNTTVYQDQNLTPGTQYGYVIAAIFPARTSAYSNEASATTTGTAPVAPTAPTLGAATSVTANGATLNWTAGSTNHTGFQLQRRLEGATVEWTTIATPAPTAVSYVDTGLTSSTTYRYRIAASNGFGTSPFSNEVTVTTLSLPIPSAPTNLVATAVSTTQINLSWSLGGTNQTAFQIERSAGSPGNWQNIAVVPGQFLTSYQNTGLNEGTTYFYRVFAVNEFGPSPASNIANATTQGTPITPPPTAPTNLTATAVSSTGINLTWTASSVTHTGFLLQRRTGSGDWTTIATPGATVTSYSDTGLTAGTTYLYRIQATSLVGPSVFSAEATATTQSGSGGGGGGSVPPPTPTGLIVTAASNTSAEIRWGASTGATQYRLYRGAQSDSTLTLIATISVTSPSPTQYVDAGLNGNATYQYQVEAVNASGTSGRTAIVTVTIPMSAFTSIENQETVTRSIGRNGLQFFRLYVPSGTTELVVTMTGSTFVDLLVQLDRQPTVNSFNCRATGSQAVGNPATRTCLIKPVIAGDWHILARSTSISNITFTLSATYSLPAGTATQQMKAAVGSLLKKKIPHSDNEGSHDPLDQDRRRRPQVRPE
jgi:fibronectin type 3 domain-containing protein